MQQNLPKLKKISVSDSSSESSFTLSDQETREIARVWHRENPEFVIDILLKTKAIKVDDTETRKRIFIYMDEATTIGFYSKKDITQYIVACLYAKGSIATALSFRKFIEQYSEDCPDIMTKFMNAVPINYWTYLPEKVRSDDRIM